MITHRKLGSLAAVLIMAMGLLLATGLFVTRVRALGPIDDIPLPLPSPTPTDLPQPIEDLVDPIVNPSPSPSPSTSPTPAPTPTANPSPTPTADPGPVGGGSGSGSPPPTRIKPPKPPVSGGGSLIEQPAGQAVGTISDQLPVNIQGFPSSASGRSTSYQGGDFDFSGGPQSTAKVLELLKKAGASPDLIARILAPFPVAGPAYYRDDWAAPRFVPYFHFHEGIDIFAERGTRVIASENGTITDLAIDTEIAGNGVKLTTASGTYYYYSHLDRFAANVSEGANVSAGDLIGYVGTTGNAEGGVPHLHFEIHPDGGLAVPPFPYLNRWLAEALTAAETFSQGRVAGAEPVSGLARLPSAILNAPSRFVQAAADAARVQGAFAGKTLPAVVLLLIATLAVALFAIRLSVKQPEPKSVGFLDW